MKKVLAILLVVIIVFTVAGCEKPTEAGSLDFTTDLGVVQKTFYNDSLKVYEGLLAMLDGVEKEKLSDEELTIYAEHLIRSMENLGSLYAFANNTCYNIEGEIYGVEDLSEVGGGKGYSDIITSGDYTVTDDDELKQALLTAKSGEVIFLPSDAAIDLSDLRITEGYIATLKKGVILASDRGNNGSKGGTIYFSAAHNTLIRCLGDNRITGLNLVGVNGTLASGGINNGSFIGINATGENIKIDNCEISGFSGTAVRMVNKGGVISDCYIHDNGSADGRGIFITNKETQAEIRSNLFANNNTDLVASSFGSLDFRGNISVGCENPLDIKNRAGQTLSGVSNTFLDAAGTIEDGFDEGEFEKNAWEFKSDKTLKLLGVAELPPEPSVKTDINKDPDIIVGIFTGDKSFVYDCLKKIAASPNEKEEVTSLIYDAISELCGFSAYYDYKDKISINKGGKIYGAYDAGGKGPIGGGVGTAGIRTGGDYRATDLDSLTLALSAAKAGEVVFIPGDVKIDLTPLANSDKYLSIPEGVILASDRGAKIGDKISVGAMLFATEHAKLMISAASSSVIEGLVICGADTSKHMTHILRGIADGSYTDYYYKLPLTIGIRVDGNGVTVRNCEISGFSNSGVLLNNVKDAHIYRNFIHHNQRNGFGYGICLSKASEAVIEYNLFNFDRHSVAADGSPGSGYIARYNIQMGEAIYHVFDAHGGRDRGDGTQIACDYVEMYNNTILTDRIPYSRRGIPQQYSKFYNNVVLYPITYYQVRRLEGANMTMYDNIFGIAEPEKVSFDYNNGKEYTVTISDFNKPLINSVNTVMLRDGDKNSYTSSELGLRYAKILSFIPDGNGGYVISEYGNNLDNGTIWSYDEKVTVPESGFVLIFNNNSTLSSIYDIIAERFGIIYNTTMYVPGGFKARVENDGSGVKITFIEGRVIE